MNYFESLSYYRKRVRVPDRTRHQAQTLPTFARSRMQPGPAVCGHWSPSPGTRRHWRCCNQGKLSVVSSQPQLPVTQSELCSDIGQSCHYWPPGPVSPVAFKCCKQSACAPCSQGMITWPSWTGAKQFYFHSFPEFQFCGGLELSTKTGFLDQEAVSK